MARHRYPFVSVVVLNWNGKHFLKDCLETLLKQDYPKFEVIVSDNGSSDGSQEFVRKNFPSVKVVENKKNLGFSGGNNAGIRVAKGEYVLLLNNDMIFHKKDCIRELVKAAESDKRIGIVGGMFLWAKEPKRIQNVYGASIPKVFPELSLEKLCNFAFGTPDAPYEEDRGQYRKLIDIDAVNGLVKREVFKKVGLYDEKFFFTYDDADFCYRAKQAGYRVVTNPKAKMWHVGAGTVSATTPFYIYHSYRGKMRFGLKHFKGVKKIGFIVINLIALPFLLIRFAVGGRLDLITPLLRAYGWNLINFRDYV
jgi:hypothetical protein